MELKELVSTRNMLKEVLNLQETYSERVEIRKDIREIETRIKEVEQQNATTQAFDYSSRSE
jgi:transcription elongation GreA/GreB family factor